MMRREGISLYVNAFEVFPRSFSSFNVLRLVEANSEPRRRIIGRSREERRKFGECSAGASSLSGRNSAN